MNWQHFVDLLHREMASGIVGSSMTRLFWRLSSAASSVWSAN